MSSYEPEIGDRVRVVLEGECVGGYVRFGQGALSTDWAIHGVQNAALSIEKILPPLPTTPGSVVKDGKDYYVMTEQGYHHVTDPLSPIAPQSQNFSRDYDVIFDAGAK